METEKLFLKETTDMIDTKGLILKISWVNSTNAEAHLSLSVDRWFWTVTDRERNMRQK